MPDPILLVQAMGMAALTAAAVVALACGWPWRAPRLAAAGAVLGTAFGLYAGCWWLGLLPRWPPREDLDRLLLFVLPGAVLVELLAATARRPSWWPWALRALLAAAVAPVLLHNSIYLQDLAGPGSRQWSAMQAWYNLGLLAAALAAVWVALLLLARRAPGRAMPFALSITCVGAGVAVMLSGYATGGQLGLPLAATLAGAIVASLALRKAPNLEGSLGFGCVGLFALLIVGRYFAELQPLHAGLLLFAPLCGWVPECPYFSRLGPRVRGVGRLVLTVVPVAIAIWLCYQRFVERSAPAAIEAPAPSIQDYLDFGK